MSKSKKVDRPFKSHVVFHRLDGAKNVVESLTLAPDDARPDWVLEQLDAGDKDHLFAGGPEQSAVDVRTTNDPESLSVQELDEGDDAAEVTRQSTDIIEGDAPPKGGPGSGVTAWRNYAETNGVKVFEDATREDVIELVEKAGLPTK